jgi:uncharacterized protein
VATACGLAGFSSFLAAVIGQPKRPDDRLWLHNYIVGRMQRMSGLRIEWDERKSTSNKRKHGVSFEEAATAFADENALLMDDPDHSAAEDRFILLGLSSELRILLICHCYRENDDVIRIISARKADRRERQQYLERWTS